MSCVVTALQSLSVMVYDCYKVVFVAYFLLRHDISQVEAFYWEIYKFILGAIFEFLQGRDQHVRSAPELHLLDCILERTADFTELLVFVFKHVWIANQTKAFFQLNRRVKIKFSLILF